MGINNVTEELVEQKKPFFVEIMRPIMWLAGGFIIICGVPLFLGPGFTLGILFVALGIFIINLTNDLYNLKKRGFWSLAGLSLLLPGFIFLLLIGRGKMGLDSWVAVFSPILIFVALVFNYRKFIN